MSEEKIISTVAELCKKLKGYRDDAKVMVIHNCPDGPSGFNIKRLGECGSGSGDFCIIDLED